MTFLVKNLTSIIYQGRGRGVPSDILLFWKTISCSNFWKTPFQKLHLEKWFIRAMNLNVFILFSRKWRFRFSSGKWPRQATSIRSFWARSWITAPTDLSSSIRSWRTSAQALKSRSCFTDSEIRWKIRSDPPLVNITLC